MKSRRMRWKGKVHVWERGEVRSGFWWGKLRERNFLEDVDLDGRIIFKCIFKSLAGLMDWVDMAQDGDRLWDLVNATLNIRVP
jgi:hypothetical protein